MLTSGEVQIEEITVEDGLNHTGHHSDLIEESLHVITPDPVTQIKRSIQTQKEQIVCGDGLGFTRLSDHEQLRKNGHRLQIDGERPQNLHTTQHTQIQEDM